MLAPHAFAAGLFGMIEIRAENISAIPKWVDVLGRIDGQMPDYRRCFADVRACPSDGMRAWSEFLAGQRDKSRGQQLDAVHRFINRWEYINDNELWGRSDYWETPRQFVENSGDCEDYSIAKYISLKELGWPDSALRMAVVHDTVRDIAHAILVVEHADTYWILDNLATKPLPHKQVLQYRPYYAVNKTTRWVFVNPTKR
ncbi:MAG: transglutaminase-like cysteine peptidase [Pseudomonadaceae bacterium]|nr:transglutaminase-like cysteine peptidase [Pseudomonadaceae bacterium]